jgi:hypothetical protein
MSYNFNTIKKELKFFNIELQTKLFSLSKTINIQSIFKVKKEEMMHRGKILFQRGLVLRGVNVEWLGGFSKRIDSAK